MRQRGPEHSYCEAGCPSPGPAEGTEPRHCLAAPPGSPKPPRGQPPAFCPVWGQFCARATEEPGAPFVTLGQGCKTTTTKPHKTLSQNVAWFASWVMPNFGWGIKRIIYVLVLLWEKDLRLFSSQEAASNSPPGGTVSQLCYGRKRRAQYSSIFKYFKPWIKHKCRVAASR